MGHHFWVWVEANFLQNNFVKIDFFFNVFIFFRMVHAFLEAWGSLNINDIWRRTYFRAFVDTVGVACKVEGGLKAQNPESIHLVKAVRVHSPLKLFDLFWDGVSDWVIETERTIAKVGRAVVNSTYISEPDSLMYWMMRFRKVIQL